MLWLPMATFTDTSHHQMITLLFDSDVCVAATVSITTTLPFAAPDFGRLVTIRCVTRQHYPRRLAAEASRGVLIRPFSVGLGVDV